MHSEALAPAKIGQGNPTPLVWCFGSLYLLCAFRVYLYRNAYTSLQVWVSGLWASASVFGESVLPEGISLRADIWETVISIEYIRPSMLKSVPVKLC